MSSAKEAVRKVLDQVKADKAISLVWNNAEFDLSDATVTLFMTLPSSP